MWTESLNQLIYFYPKVRNYQKKIIFHGSMHPAKGYEFILELASILKDYEFIIPVFQGQTYFNKLNNIEYQILDWDNGLKDLIENSYLTICPSLWSSANEAALIKSILIAPKVAVVDLEYSFIKEIPNDLLLRLKLDTTSAANTITQFCNNFEPTPFEIRKGWFTQYIQKCKMERLFVN